VLSVGVWPKSGQAVTLLGQPLSRRPQEDGMTPHGE